ncbi:MAG: archease [Nitrosopumilaceae archaeon]
MSYKILEHVTDAFIEVTASDLNEAFIIAANSVVELTLDRDKVKEVEKKIITVKGRDLRYLLLNWLESIIFMLITEGFAIKRIQLDLQKNDDYNIFAKVYGEPIDLKKHNFKVEIKAPTFHEMSILEGKEIKMKFLLDL